jgi:dihydroorotase
MADFVLQGGRIIDPSQGLDRVTDIAFAEGKVVAIGDGLKGDKIRDVSGSIVTPGLIDLHTHVYWGGTSLGVDAEDFARNSAVTTCVDTGSAGPGNFPGFRTHVIEPSAVRILAYLNISYAGIYAFSKRVMVGEAEDLRLLAARDAVEVARANPDVIIGIKVRLGRNTSGTAGIAPLEVALQVADETGLPLMVHIDEPPPSYEEVLDLLRPGDVLTHCFRPFPNAPMKGDGTIKPQVTAARARGVIFDIGHGKGSFSWKTAKTMMGNGFLPDTISSDVHTLCIEGPAYDLVTTMSKFLHLGMDLAQVIAAATLHPARALRRPELGSLKIGSIGDASVLGIKTGRFALEDVMGEVETAERRIMAEGVVLAGQWWHPV